MNNFIPFPSKVQTPVKFIKYVESQPNITVYNAEKVTNERKISTEYDLYKFFEDKTNNNNLVSVFENRTAKRRILKRLRKYIKYEKVNITKNKTNLSQQRKMVSNYKQGGIAKGCGDVLDNRRKVTKKY